MDTSEIQAILNGSGLTSMMGGLQRLLAITALEKISGVKRETASPYSSPEMLLNAIGPAAAQAAMDHAIQVCKSQGKFQTVHFNGSVTHNMELVKNSPLEECNNFTSVLRQFLLPRYAYLDFDAVVDPRHRIDEECGYPKFITPIMYRYMYDRDDVARRVVDIYPDESWAVDPDVYETDDETVTTPFEAAWQELCDTHNVMQYLYRMDKLSGIGHYGALLLGIDDGMDLDQPVAGILEDGTLDPNFPKDFTRKLLYMRPFDEYLSFIHMYETDVTNRRYGLPKFYNLVFLDMTIDAAGASIGTRLNRRVHWTRVVHVADNLMSSLVFGTPRMQPVFNRLLDLRKIKGGSGEMYWKGAFPGISFEIDPRFVADDPDFDKDAFRREIENYANGLQRYLTTIGVSAKSLAPNISENPDRHVKIQIEAIASHAGVPTRIFMGSEESRLASSQDKLTWNQRLGRRNRTFTEPSLIRNFADRLMLLRILPMTKKYFVGWGDLNTSTDEDKANLALKWTQALSQYVASGVIHLINPLDYMILILGLRPSDATRINDYVMKNGGYEKLQKVDPSQGAGVNGKAENNVSKGDKEGTSGERPQKRESSDKKQEGSSS
jgi:uncharacterized protein